ncbi:MAG: hypothetical protein ABIK28_00710 [Planctomycetota bacterium]
MKTRVWLSALLLLLLGIPAWAEDPDALVETLQLVGMKRADLGWAPKGWWPRFPDVPYKLRSFDSLFAAPLDNVAYTRCLARIVRDKLDPALLDKDQGRGTRSLFQAVQALGMDPKFGGFRGYTANVLAPEMPLDEAILELVQAAGHSTTINTFGMDLPYPRPRESLAEKVKVLPEGVSPILGQLVLNLVDAHRWAELAFRRVDGAVRLKVANHFAVGEEMIDAFDYAPEIDDLALSLDEASLWNAAQKCVQALDDARVTLKALDPSMLGGFAFDWESPWGWIRVRGTGNDKVDGFNSLLIVDLGGNDTYTGPVAASSAGRPLSLLLDLGGNDIYTSEGPAQGAGLCGAGILIDEEGDDMYTSRRYGQGVGQFGLGLCADLGGDDHYFCRYSGQGCGYFGIGLLFDAAGNDAYRLFADGQGLGGVNGVGVLADHSGNDTYTAERCHTVTGRPSYHSPDLDVGVSNAQGCGMGRRGDGSDGHSWAGGLGALFDTQGNDTYTAGNWAMGTGYWFGIGMLHDGAGDDVYHGVAYSQASGAHFCIGVLIDEAGNDKHLSEENSRNSLAWAHDFTISILVDAAGDDLYEVGNHGMAYSINRSVAMLLDAGGSDTYKVTELKRPGFAENAGTFGSRDGVTTYFADTTSIGLFLDIGGKDQYFGEIKNNTVWMDPDDSPNWKDRNFSIGVDREEGVVDFTPVPMRAPSGTRVQEIEK